MRLANVEDVEEEITRLLERIRVLKREGKRREIDGVMRFCDGCQKAAVRRASMDLTRALARLRRAS